jgi:hypothetical protein
MRRICLWRQDRNHLHVTTTPRHCTTTPGLQQEKIGGLQILQRRTIAQRIRRDTPIQRGNHDVRPWTRYHGRKYINRSTYSALYASQILAADLLPEVSCAATVARRQPHKSILVMNGTLLYRPQNLHLYRVLADMYRMN